MITLSPPTAWSGHGPCAAWCTTRVFFFFLLSLRTAPFFFLSRVYSRRFHLACALRTRGRLESTSRVSLPSFVSHYVNIFLDASFPSVLSSNGMVTCTNLECRHTTITQKRRPKKRSVRLQSRPRTCPWRHKRDLSGTSGSDKARLMTMPCGPGTSEKKKNINPNPSAWITKP